MRFCSGVYVLVCKCDYLTLACLPKPPPTHTHRFPFSFFSYHQEETLKYMTPLRFRACKHSACPYVYLVCAVACALGFSTVENIGYTFQVQLLSSATRREAKAHRMPSLCI